jgi:hypothetical protein
MDANQLSTIVEIVMIAIAAIGSITCVGMLVAALIRGL